MRKIQIMAAILILQQVSFGQTPDTDALERQAEFLETENSNGDIESSLNDLDESSKQRKKWNETTISFLESLPCTDPLKLAAIYRHIEECGELLCKEELQVISGFTKQEIECLSGYILFPDPFRANIPNTLSDKNDIHTEITQSVRKIQLNAATPTAFSEAFDPWKAAFRARIRIDDCLKLGINAEKDAGESWWNKTGPDHIGYFIQWKPSEHPFRLIVGDYRLQIGQGLVYGRSSIGGVSNDLITLKRNGFGAYPFSSMAESGYLRGGALTMQFSKLQALVFSSHTRLDGSKQWSADSSVCYFKEDLSGLHRTDLEQTRINTSARTCFGGSISYRNANTTVGVLLASCNEKYPSPPADLLNEMDNPTTLRNLVGELNYQFATDRFLLFGECAFINGLHLSAVNGILINPDKRISVGLNHRVSNKNYSSNYNSPFGLSQNGMQSLYAGINFRITPSFQLNAYADRFHISWLQYGIDSPQRGCIQGIKLTCNIGKKIETYLSYRTKSTVENNITRDVIPEIDDYIVSQARYQLTIQPSFGWQVKYRVEFKWTHGGNVISPTASMAFQDIHYQSNKYPISFTFRLAVFHSESYETAIYAQESDLPLTYATSAYYGQGTRYYLLVHIALLRNLDGWIRIGNTTVVDRLFTDELSQTTGNVRRDLALQLRWQL